MGAGPCGAAFFEGNSTGTGVDVQFWKEGMEEKIQKSDPCNIRNDTRKWRESMQMKMRMRMRAMLGDRELRAHACEARRGELEGS